MPTAWAAPDGGPATAMAPATSAVLTVKKTSSPAASTSAPNPAGRPARSQAITAEAAAVASTKTAVVYACLYGGTRGPTERHHRCPCTTTAHSPAQPGDNSAAAAKNQTDAMLTCSSPATRAAAEALGIAAELGVQHRHDDDQRRGAQRRMRVGRGPEARGRQQQPAEHEQHRTALHGEQRRDQRGGEAPQLPLPDTRPRRTLRHADPDRAVLTGRGV